MSLGGFKKQFNKTSQFLSEKVGGSKGTQLEDEFMELARKHDVVNECVENIQEKTKAYLQPNPAARAKLAVQDTVEKAGGKPKSKYRQPEYSLAKVFTKAGEELNDGSPYSSALTELGSSFNRLSDVKDSMEDNITQEFLDPLYELQKHDLKELNHHRKKLESRRLDYDYKKGKGHKISEEELEIAEDKFESSKKLYYNGMMNFIDNDTEHIGQLLAFAENIRDYHKRCAGIMESVTETLSARLAEAESRPRNTAPGSSTAKHPTHPCAKALYDFEPENEGELEIREGDMIELTSQIDDNWLEGSCNGHHGYFPSNYVDILVPL